MPNKVFIDDDDGLLLFEAKSTDIHRLEQEKIIELLKAAKLQREIEEFRNSQVQTLMMMIIGYGIGVLTAALLILL